MHKITYRKDYKPSDFLISEIFLKFNVLNFNEVEVTSNIIVSFNNKEKKCELVLNGENLKTNYIKINNVLLKNNEDYTIENNTLKVKPELLNKLTNNFSKDNSIYSYISNFFDLNKHNNTSIKNSFVIETKVTIDPSINTSLMGIYQSKDYLCSQCEPEGFRRITWYIDRPDIMAKFQVAIEANKDTFPVLLSNGNNIFSKELKNNRHVAVFKDPFKKPSYLFAFVAGDFDCLHSIYTTKISNKKVDLYIYTDKEDIEKASYAMDSLKKAMLWDEETYNLEYDLNTFSIVAVKDFNFGAMENKSLNIFNEIFVLANPNLVTDKDFINIEGIVAHEYFHNYTGNRVTCRDWFQLTLKEGLTVYRDNKFSESLHYKDSIRISNIELLRSKQFEEDNGPLSHPIRPESYIEIDNFYTKTVYEKGSEVVRMTETLLGEQSFIKGVKHYLNKFDGTAATCEDFISSLEEASGVSLSNFKKWYSSNGTPVVSIETLHDTENKQFTIKLSQQIFSKDSSLVIPLKMALFSSNGRRLKLNVISSEKSVIFKEKSHQEECLLVLENTTQQFTFTNIEEEPVLSINRDFSAPVITEYKNQTNNTLSKLIEHDNNGFIKYDASKIYLINITLEITKLLNNNHNTITNEILKYEHAKDIINNTQLLTQDLFQPFINILSNILTKEKHSFSSINLIGMILNSVSFSDISKNFTENIPVKSIYNALRIVKIALTENLEEYLVAIYNKLKDNEQRIFKEDAAIRLLKSNILNLLVSLEQEKYFIMAKTHYFNTTNMTNKIGALLAIKDYSNTTREMLFNDFLNNYKDQPIVINKYLFLEAVSLNSNVINTINKLQNNKELFSFYNPNNVRFLFNSFAFSNHLFFHNNDGSGYKLITECIIKLDRINPNLAASLSSSFASINNFWKNNKSMVLNYISSILNNKSLSKGTYEILNNILRNIKVYES